MNIADAILIKQRSLKISTKAQLARRIGVSLSTLYNLLGDSHGVDSRTLSKYARFLNWPVKRVMLSAPRQRHSKNRPGRRPKMRA
jgi:hypothetical protein